MAKDNTAPVKVSLDVLAAARASVAALGKREFLEEYARLTKQFSSDPGNPGSYACKDCEGCANCIRCELCNNCTHCIDSRNCHSCAYCIQSENCTGSAYLVMSKSMSECNYCFGCVGLRNKDFHILNVEFSRTEYFKVVNKLRRDLGIPA